MTSQKPMARITEVNREFWEGCNRDELMLQQCMAADCRRYIYYPRVCCPYCGNDELAWRRVSGRAKIVSFARIHREQHESYAADVPYYFAALQLEEGPLMFGRLLDDVSSEKNIIGRSVVAQFVEQTPTQKLPFFRLV